MAYKGNKWSLTWIQLKSVNGSNKSVYLLLDPICQNDESNENSDGAIQKPDISVVFEDFSADQNGKSHDGTNHRVKP